MDISLLGNAFHSVPLRLPGYVVLIYCSSCVDTLLVDRCANVRRGSRGTILSLGVVH
jgi:hypothetical protein